MSTSTPLTIPFSGKRLRFESARPYSDVLSALLADIGEKPISPNAIAQAFESWDEYEAKINSHAGPSGFMLFSLIDHGAWVKKAGIHRKAIRVLLGNPLVAISILRHDLTAGLFAPVELLLMEEEGNRSSLTYLLPSSLMVIEPNAPLLTAAQALDRKLQALAEQIVSSH